MNNTQDLPQELQQRIEGNRGKLNKMSIAQLKQVIVGLSKIMTDESMMAENFAMDVLEHRIPEAEFVAFCDSL